MSMDQNQFQELSQALNVRRTLEEADVRQGVTQSTDMMGPKAARTAQGSQEGAGFGGGAGDNASSPSKKENKTSSTSHGSSATKHKGSFFTPILNRLQRLSQMTDFLLWVFLIFLIAALVGIMLLFSA